MNQSIFCRVAISLYYTQNQVKSSWLRAAEGAWSRPRTTLKVEYEVVPRVPIFRSYSLNLKNVYIALFLGLDGRGRCYSATL